MYRPFGPGYNLILVYRLSSSLLLCAFLTTAAFGQTKPFAVEEATIGQVHREMQAGRLTCHDLVATYLKRIATYDKVGPAVNSLVLINPEVQAQADELDGRYRQSGFVGPLHCVPVIVKDNFQTQGIRTSNGSLSLSTFVPDKDAFQVERMKRAGALVLAKSNMAEWAFSPYETVSSILPGYTKNPYALDRVTAGSSGGTAAAIAASFGLVGLGSDTGNSIRGPSSHQSLVGIRSTMGLTSRRGVLPLNLLADIAGPITRTVEDAALVLSVVAGSDPNDPVTAEADAHLPKSYTAALRPDALRGATIGILRQAYERDSTDPEIVQVFNRAIEDLRRAGANVIEAKVDLETIKRATEAGPCMGFKYDINRYLASQGELVPVKNLDEIIQSGRFHPSVQYRLEQAQKSPENGPDSEACQADRKYRQNVREAVLQTMDTLHLDAFVYPTWSNPPRLIGDLNTPAGDNSQFFSPTTGFPAINVPMGYTRGGQLPAGMTIYGRPWSEERLLALAYAYEQATHWRRSPGSTPPLSTPDKKHPSATS